MLSVLSSSTYPSTKKLETYVYGFGSFVNTSVSQQNLDGRRVCAFSSGEQKRFNPGQNVFSGRDYADSYKKLGPEAFADIFAPKK